MLFNFKNVTINCFNINGEPWFLSNDVCAALGYTDVSHTILDHTSEDDRKVLKYSDWVKMTETESQNKRARVLINESALYCLIFGSKKEGAVEFKHWVSREVLPSIRQNGGYIDGQENLTSKERDILLNEIKILSDAVEKTMEERNRIAKKWHKAVGDKKHLLEKVKIQKVKISKQKSDIALLNRDADDFYDIYTKVLEELAEAENKIRVLKDKMSPAPKKVAKPVIPETGNTFTITTDREGRVIGIA